MITFRYRTALSGNRVIIASIIIWTLSIGLTFIYFTSGFILYTFIYTHTAVIFTLVVLLFTYLKIFLSLRSQVQNWSNLSEEQNDDNKQIVKWEKKITKTFLIMLALFMACYFPSIIVVYIMNLCTTCSCDLIHVARDLQIMLVMANSSMNPFVYGWRLQNFRQAFKRIVMCRWVVRKIRSLSRSMVTISVSLSD